MYIKREQLLNKLIRYRKKDIVKVITGIRRCGKSVLLNELFYEYLLSDGVPSDHIIKVSLDLKKWEALRNGDMLYHYIAEAIHDDELYYSHDINTIFRGRGIEIKVFPLSFAEFHDWKGGDLVQDWDEFKTFGGMPQTVLERNERDKIAILNELFGNVYMRDVIERNRIADPALLEAIVDVVASSVGSLTNPKKLSDTIISREGSGPSAPTVRKS